MLHHRRFRGVAVAVALAGALTASSVFVLVFVAFLAAPRVVRVSDIMERPAPSELAFNEPGGQQVFFRDPGLVLRVSSILMHEQARMISKAEAGSVRPAVSFDFGYKGNTVLVLSDGSAIISQDKAVIRNKSPLHYLWWRTRGRPWEGAWLHYRTPPNRALLDAVLAAKSSLAR